MLEVGFLGNGYWEEDLYAMVYNLVVIVIFGGRSYWVEGEVGLWFSCSKVLSLEVEYCDVGVGF